MSTTPLSESRSSRQTTEVATHITTTAEHSVGSEIFEIIERLYPICRSITGEGVRETLGILQEYLPLETHHVPTGTQVFDWTIPKEWAIRDAHIDNIRGERVVDFRNSNLHVVSYSTPVNRRVSLKELREHVHSLPDHPDWIPYRTSYYEHTWGFCLSHNQLQNLTDDEYDVCIDSTLFDGVLNYGECYLPGRKTDEVIVSCHLCHPSLCNDNLSGVGLATLLAKRLAERSHEYSYRFLFLPGTIGPITWLCRNEDQVDRIKHGLVLSCIGDRGNMTYKKSRQGDAEVDRVVQYVLEQSAADCTIVDFSPYGNEERQYCSPGFNLPVGSLMRTPHAEFPQYHTSADDLSFICPEALGDSLENVELVFEILEANRVFVNLLPKCEPQLGKRGLYRSVGGWPASDSQMALLWVLNLSDGGRSLLDIAQRSKMPFALIRAAATELEAADLLQNVGKP